MSADKIARRDLFKRTAAAGLGFAGVAGLGVNVAQAQEPAAPDVPMLDKVPTKTLGATGAKVPILLMGGSQVFDARYDRMLHRAFQDGVFYIDTAVHYANGQSHATLAPFIQQISEKHGRDALWITSKSGLWGDDNGGASPTERYIEDMEKGIQVLGVDYIDMFFMHGIENPETLTEPYIRMGQDFKKRGLTKFFGFSCHDGTVVELLNKAADIGTAGIDAIMFRYNFTMYGDLELNKAMDRCIKAGIGLLAMKTQSSVPEDSDMVQKFTSESFTLHQARLKAAWADERISACVSGINNTRILKENTDAAKSQTQLAMNEYQQLRQYAIQTAHHNCKGCNHLCESKVAGNLRIGDQLRYLMYAECYGNFREARAMYAALREDQRAFQHLDLSGAEAACPQGIKIRERLETAQLRLA
ncbi:MAG: aldo/keto reductase [Candidatus Hydrogenedentales bacterium]